MDRKELLLLVVAAGQGNPLEPVQLQKALFLIGQAGLREIAGQLYQFEPYHYGPFDVNIYHDADKLHAEGVLVRMPSARGTWVDTTISPEGARKAAELQKQLSPSSREFIQAVVAWVQSQPFNSLVKKIYDLYPQFRQNSVFQG